MNRGETVIQVGTSVLLGAITCRKGHRWEEISRLPRDVVVSLCSRCRAVRVEVLPVGE